MAGKRHHYIPRFLQRGFLNENAKKDYTFIYLNDGAKRTSKIDNVGVEGFFYSADGETDLDHKITELEGKYAQHISKLRENPLISISFEEIAEIIFHFEIRTNNFRRNFHSSGEVFLHKMKERFTERNMLEPILRAELNNKLDNSDEVDKLLIEGNAPKNQREKLKKEIRERAGIFVDVHMEKILITIKDAMEFNISKRFKDVVKKGHINGMTKGLNENNKVNIYKSLNYKIINTDFNILLSDSIVIFEMEGLSEFKPFYDTKDILKAIYFPISSNLLIYAFTNEDDPKLSVLNEMSAKCSKDFFIACEDSPYFELMQKCIGINCQLLTESEMHTILNDVIQETMSKI